MLSSLHALPTDVHLVLLAFLNAPDLGCLAQTCRLFYALISEHGWTIYRRLHLNDSLSPSMNSIFVNWDDRLRVRNAHLTARNWTQRRFAAQALCTPWPGIFQPVLVQHMSSSRMAVLAGNALLTFGFHSAPIGNPSRIRLETRVALPHATARNGQRDLVGGAFISDRTMIVALYDGTVHRLHLPGVQHTPLDHPSRYAITATYERAPGLKNVHALAAAGQTAVVLGRTGQVALYRANAPWQPPSTALLPGARKGRSWAAYIAPDVSYAAFGRAHVDHALAVHPIRPDSGIDAVDFTALSGARPGKSGYAVYSLGPMEPSGNPNLLLSGWFDGRARGYDLRMPAASNIVLTLRDQWASEGLFSVSAAGHRVALGTLRHGLVALFDIRAPGAGWSVYAPGRAENSPVYGLALEESRLIGITRTRAFAFDFGPGADAETFPTLMGETSVQHSVSMYEHSKG
ncbi:hypothetical protein BKA62DRAFT_709521, partial [Auriculariales sp. MPI-PUGE-AT-0066]